MVNEGQKVEITSVGDFLNEVRRLQSVMDQKVQVDADEEEEHKFAAGWFFRGQGSFEWEMVPGLFRQILRPKGTEERRAAGENLLSFEDRTLLSEEQFLLQEAERYCPEAFTLCKEGASRASVAHMAVAQHYGIPTRLLDVSSNALVALYFAVAEDERCNEKDASVFIFRTDSDQYKLASTGGCVDVSRIQKGVMWLNQPLLVFPPFVTERQRAQSGAFMFFGNAYEECRRCEPDFEHIGRIRIPLAYKKNLRLELSDTCGIFQEMLFPNAENLYKEHIVRMAKKRVVARALAKCNDLWKSFDVDA